MSNRVRGGLVNRWAHMNPGAYTVNNMKKDITPRHDDPRAYKFLKWALAFDRTSKQDQFKDNVAPFERIFLDVGAEILKNARGLLSLSPNAESIRNELDRTIVQLSSSKDIKKIKQFRQQLKRLEDVGMDNLVPTEGIVFVFNGKIFKLTGTFAPLNQLIGLLKYSTK